MTLPLTGSWPKFAYMSWYGTRSSMVRCSAVQFHRVDPAWPFFVVTRTTPFAAFVPYSVAADGPFTISMFSISSGLSEPSNEKFTSVPDCRLPAEYRTPSTYQIGAFDKLIDDTPRMRTVGAPPSSVPGRIVTLGDFAIIMLARLLFGRSSTCCAMLTV